MFVKEYRKPTPEEVAKYHADQEAEAAAAQAAVEAAKPIVPYVTRVKHNGMEWRCLGGPDPDGYYDLHRVNEDGSFSGTFAKRHKFKVID